MDRRSFNKLMLASAGIGALPLSLARADQSTGGGAVPPSISPSAYPTLFERARDALGQHSNVVALRDRVALADFTRASRDLRFHIVDLISGQSWSYLVAHGKGSDPEHSGWLQRFSNEMGSLATSAGAYLTGEIYEGVHGRSMRLVGLDDVNSNAEPRAIVIHGADYVSENHIAAWGKCGRSEGCFAVAPHMLEAVLALLGPGRMLYSDKI